MPATPAQQLLDAAIKYHGSGQLEQAELLYRQALDLEPGNHNVLHLLGVIYYQGGALEQAEALIRRAVQVAPKFAEAYSNLGVVHQAQQRLEEAAAAYERALALKPKFTMARFNLGNVRRDQGRLQDAIACYRKALTSKPDHVEAQFNLGNALRNAGNNKDAAAAYRKVLALNPQNDTARHWIDALTQRQTDRAPANYVREVFDDYAENFDRHLVEGLGYQTPRVLADTLRELSLPQKLEVLDLGCGTGLFGLEIHERASRLVGVDLSPKMITKARERGIYHELAVSDIVDFSNGVADASFDVIAAADVFVYLGDLAKIFHQAQRILRPQGVFAFTVETNTEVEQDYRLELTGRYVHNRNYLGKLAQQEGLNETCCISAVIRQEKGVPVNGYVLLYSKR
jgi:predicted TPR repeat methyltransferase